MLNEAQIIKLALQIRDDRRPVGAIICRLEVELHSTILDQEGIKIGRPIRANSSPRT